MTARELFVFFYPLLRKTKDIFTDNGRDRNLDPLLLRPFTGSTIAGRITATLTQRTSDFLSLGPFRLAKTCSPLVCRIAEHCPNSRAVPCGFPSPGCNTQSVKFSINLPHAQGFFSIPAINIPYYFCLPLDYIVIGSRGFRLFNIAVPIRRPGQNIY